MIIGHAPIRPLSEHRQSAGGGVHVLATRYAKGTRLEPHTHREAQLVFATEGTMQVTTPKGRWLVPPDRAVWMPAGLPHAIDVLADIEMRSLYFDAGWMAPDDPQRAALDVEFVVRVSELLHQAILALYDGRNDPKRNELLIRLAVLELREAEDSTTFIPLPHEPRCRRAADMVLADPTASYEI